jgi:hypothetical protein
MVQACSLGHPMITRDRRADRGERRSAFLKEWGCDNAIAPVVLLLSLRAGAWQRRVGVSVGCRVPHHGSSI